MPPTSSAHGDVQPPTTLLVGGRIYSPSDPTATALLTRGDRVVWVGSDAAAEAHRDAADLVIPLGGSLVTPAFVDAHVHATSTGLLLTGLNLVDCTSLTQALDRIEQYCRNTGAAGIVLGTGWDETRWPERRPPTRQEVDRASYGAQLYLTRIDVHSAIASSAMMAMLPGIEELEGYDASGLLTRDAHHHARAVAIDAVTPAARRAAQRETRAHCARLGVGALHELGGPEISSPDDFADMLALAASEPGPDVVGYWGELGGIEIAQELGALGAAGDLFADGAIGSHTACLSSHYADDDSFGSAYLTRDEVRDHVVACTHAGLQAGFHAIGDGAMQTVIGGCEDAAAEVGGERFRAARHRIEHVEMVDADLIARMARLGLYASVQPAFDELWGGANGMYAERLGVDRALTLNPLASIAAAGVPLALGSDSPVTPIAPWDAIRAATQHHVEAQRLSPEVAFSAHTVGGWRAAGVEDAGTLEPGKQATYAIWSTTGTDATLPDLTERRPAPECLRTVVGGRDVFTHEGAWS